MHRLVIVLLQGFTSFYFFNCIWGNYTQVSVLFIHLGKSWIKERRRWPREVYNVDLWPIVIPFLSCTLLEYKRWVLENVRHCKYALFRVSCAVASVQVRKRRVFGEFSVRGGYWCSVSTGNIGHNNAKQQFKSSSVNTDKMFSLFFGFELSFGRFWSPDALFTRGRRYHLFIFTHSWKQSLEVLVNAGRSSLSLTREERELAEAFFNRI